VSRPLYFAAFERRDFDRIIYILQIGDSHFIELEKRSALVAFADQSVPAVPMRLMSVKQQLQCRVAREMQRLSLLRTRKW
jgi:hypothetical protein